MGRVGALAFVIAAAGFGCAPEAADECVQRFLAAEERVEECDLEIVTIREPMPEPCRDEDEASLAACELPCIQAARCDEIANDAAGDNQFYGCMLECYFEVYPEIPKASD